MAKIDLKTAPVNVLQEILDACNRSFQKELNTEDFYGEGQITWAIPEVGLVYKNTQSIEDLRNLVYETTGTKNIRQAYAKIYETWEAKSKETETTTEIPEYISTTTETPAANTLTPDELKELQRIQESQSEKSKQIRERQKETVEAGVKKQQEIYAKTQAEKANLSQKQQEDAKRIIQEIKNAPPKEFDRVVEDVKQEIKSKVPEDIPDSAIDLTAKAIVINVQTNFAPTIQTAVVSKTVEKPEYKDLAAILSDQTKTLQEQKDLISLTQNVTKLAFGDLQKELLPDISVEEVSELPSAGFVPINIPSVYKTVTETAEAKTVTFGQTWVQQQLSGIGEGNIQGNYNPKLLQSSFSSFRPLTGTAKNLASNAVKNLATKAAGKTAAKLGLKAAFSKVTAGAGMVLGGPVGTVAGGLLGEIASRLDLAKIKKYGLAIISAPIAIVGLVFAIPVLTIGGALGVGIGIGLGQGMTVAGVGAGIGSFFSALGSATLGAIGIPILVTLLVFPVVVALILFIINSGAYIVPPSPLAGTSENLYIEVKKTAEPAGPFQNSDLPLTIKYTITVRAKRGDLTNISFKHECKAIQKGSSQDCEAPTESPPSSISPSTPYVYLYETSYNSSYDDALVVNTFTVTADSGEAKSQTTSGVATITIGEPPTDCFDIAEETFRNEGLTYITNAVSKLISDYNPYASKICASRGGEKIIIKYAGSDPDYWGYFENPDIRIYSRGLANQPDTDYILFHELAHVLATYADTWYDQYIAYPGIKNEPYPYCFYDYSQEGPPPWPFSERFAEAASFYANDPCGNFKQKNPAHYRFMNEVLFKP